MAGGIFNSGTVIGSFVAPPLIVAISLAYGWRMAFVLPSLLGLLWIIPWLWFYRDRKSVSTTTTPIPVMQLLRIPEVWGAMLARALSGPVLHFYWYWLPEYLKRERHVSMQAIALLAAVPFLFAGLGNVAGGWFSGKMMSKGWSADRARKLSFKLGALLCACSIFVPLVPGEIPPVMVICVAVFGISGFVATHIAMLTDLFPGRVLARVAGITGFGEGCVNMVVTLATGVVVDHFSYMPVFIAAGFMPMLAVAACLLLITRIQRLPESLTGACLPDGRF